MVGLGGLVRGSGNAVKQYRRRSFVRSCSSCWCLVRKSFRTFSSAESTGAPWWTKNHAQVKWRKGCPLVRSSTAIVQHKSSTVSFVVERSKVHLVRVDRVGKYRAAPCWIGEFRTYMPHIIANTTRRRQRPKGRIQLSPKMKTKSRAKSLATPAARDEHPSRRLLRRNVLLCSSRTTAQLRRVSAPFSILSFPPCFVFVFDYSCFAIDGRR
jgi:hypothetical protein